MCGEYALQGLSRALYTPLNPTHKEFTWPEWRIIYLQLGWTFFSDARLTDVGKGSAGLYVCSIGPIWWSGLFVWSDGGLVWSDGLVSCSGLIWWPGLAVCSDQLIWCCVVWWSVWGKWRRLFEATTKLKWKRNLITKWQQKLLNSEVTMLKQTDRIREVKMVFFSLFFLKSSIRLNISAWVHQITVSLIHLVQQHSVKKRTECYILSVKSTTQSFWQSFESFLIMV